LRESLIVSYGMAVNSPSAKSKVAFWTIYICVPKIERIVGLLELWVYSLDWILFGLLAFMLT
jgi:hypothetical protein